MGVVEISDENRESFLPLLGDDLSADLKRVYYGGIGALDGGGQPVGAFVYELFDSESEEDTKSRICFLKSDSREITGSMESYYTQNSVREDEVVESFYELGDEMDAKAMTEFGFSFDKKEDDTITCTLSDIAKTEFGKKRKLPDHVGNIEDLSVIQFRDAVKDILFKGHEGASEDIPFLPKNWYDNSISACITSGGKIPGLFLVRRTPSGTLIPMLFFCFGPEFQKNLIYMLQYSVQKAIELYPLDTVVKISRINPATKALTDRFLPGRRGADVFFGTRKEQ